MSKKKTTKILSEIGIKTEKVIGTPMPKRKYKKSKKLIKVTSPVKKDGAFFIASELADDKLIEKEVLGQATKTMVYEYLNENDEVVYGLSYQGVREVVRTINRQRDSGHRIQVSDKPPIIERDITMQGVSGVEVQVYAVDAESGGGSWGLKFEPWRKQIFDGKGTTIPNCFALEQALSKAQRNAMFNLLPVNIIEKMIAKFVKEKESMQKIKAPKEIIQEVELKKSPNERMYKSTLDRIGKISKDKKALENALTKIDNMPINGKQRGQIRRKISTYLKKINKKQ